MATDFSESKVYGTKRVWPAKNLPPKAPEPAKVEDEDAGGGSETGDDEAAPQGRRRRRAGGD